MVFSSITFLFYFLPILLIIYYIVPNKIKNLVLFLASMLFYAYGEPKNVWLMLFSTLVVYCFGLLIDKYRGKKVAKLFLILPIAINILLLVYFKYFNFIIKNVNLFLANKIDLINVILPIGISFYTFQMISYIVDVYKKEVKVQKNFLNLATYITFFPQLIAGPIVRYKTVEKSLNERNCTKEVFSNGIRRFIIGLGKKVLIANILGELIKVYGSAEKTVLFNIMYAVANMLQIYFDFSGYSDMAIGLAKMFGFEFLENFNYPYMATSVTDFWRRWHISLSSFFRDYIYIPLGGNRVSKLKWIRNIFIVWFLTGLWHGASYNFIIWGLYFGVILLIEKVFLSKILEKTPKIINRVYVLLIVMFSFIIFSAENLKDITNIFKTTIVTTNESMYYLKSYLVVFIIGIIGATNIPKNICQRINSKFLCILEPIFLISILVVSVSYIVDGSFNPFLYFRF